MMFCKRCGNTLPDDAKFCERCGTPQISPDTSGISSGKEKADGSGTSNAGKLGKYLIIGIVGVIALVIIIAGVFSYVNLGAGFVATQKSADTTNSGSPAETTRIITAVTTRQDDSWINASIDSDNMEVTVGDICTMTGAVSGTNGPITYSVYTYEDIKNKNDSNSVITKSFSPSADGTYKLDLMIDPNIFPVGSYVIYFKIPNGQTTKLQFLVDAKGADCQTICDKVYSSSQYKEGLQYNTKGEAVCYC
jgi:archaellin